MWGVVGMIHLAHEVIGFIKHHQNLSDDEVGEYVLTHGRDKCEDSFEKYEVNFLCEGTPMGYAMKKDSNPDGVVDIYYLVRLDEWDGESSL